MLAARILLVEDDEVLCNVLGQNLQARGHEVSMASDMQHALACLHTKDFDLIVLDINLPDQTGWEVLRAAKREECLSPKVEGDKLPVVILSAVRMSPRRLAEFRPLAYLPKPFPLEALLRLAAEAAQRRNAATRSASGEAMGSGTLIA